MSARRGTPQVIVARRPGSLGDVAVGPFRSARTADAAKRELAAMGWTFHDAALTLISGADLKHKPQEG